MVAQVIKQWLYSPLFCLLLESSIEITQLPMKKSSMIIHVSNLLIGFHKNVIQLC